MTVLRLLLATATACVIAGCGGMEFWQSDGGLFITGLNVIPNPVRAGSIAEIDVDTEDTRKGIIPDFPLPKYYTVSAGQLYESREEAQSRQPEPYNEGGGQALEGYDAWWVAPETPQEVTITVRYGGDEKSAVVSVVAAQ